LTSGENLKIFEPPLIKRKENFSFFVNTQNKFGVLMAREIL
jgi:hypothetical protein